MKGEATGLRVETEGLGSRESKEWLPNDQRGKMNNGVGKRRERGCEV
jgi:hypothetical protein